MSTKVEFERCLAQFRSPDPSVRREAVEALAECDEVGAVPALVEGLRDESPGVQEAAMASLVRIGGAGVVALLVPLLRQEVATRNLAVEVLEQIGATALDRLIPLLTDQDPRLRKVIVDTLGKLGDRRAVPALMAGLQDEDPNVRGATAEALGALRAHEAVPELLGMLQDVEWVVFSVVEALGRLGAPASIPPLLDLIRAGSEPVRYAAIEALGRFPEAGACVEPMVALLPSADAGFRDLLVKSIVSLASSCGRDLKALVNPDSFVPALSGALTSDDEEIVRAAVKGFGMVEDLGGAKAILERLERLCLESEERSDELFDEAAWALARCADEGALVAALQSPVERVVLLAVEAIGKLRVRAAVQPLANLLRTRPEREIRRAAVKALGVIRDPSAAEVLIAALDDEAGYVRGEAAAILGRRGDRAGIAPLLRRLAVERYADARAAIVEALCAVPYPEVSEHLTGLLGHVREEVREAAARGLGKLRAPAAFNPLRAAANDPAWSVRVAVTEAVGRYPLAVAFEALLLALSDDHEKVRVAAVQALAGREEPEAVEVLRSTALADGDVWVRCRAAEVLGKKRAAVAVPALLEIAKGKREPGMLRRAAVQALGHIGDARVTDTLARLQSDHDPEVAAAAVEALDALLGGGQGGDPWK